MIQTHEQITGGERYLGFARQKLSFLDFARKEAGSPSMTWGPVNVGDATIYIVSAEDGNLIRIEGTGGVGFICLPRIPGVNAGWKGSEVVPLNSEVYPLSDADGASRTMLSDDEEKYKQDFEPQLYGNIDWIGKNTAAEDELSDASVLTWKGPPGRSLPFDYHTPIEGLTVSDISFNEDAYFTVFGPNIYSGGEILSTIPATGDVDPKVLGCAIQGLFLIAIVNNHYSDRVGFFDEVWFASIGMSGLYDEQDNPGGWQKIDERTTGRPTLCWFFNQSGTKATQGVYEYSIDCIEKTATRAEGTPGSVTMTVTSNIDGSKTTTHAGECLVWSDYEGDVRVIAKVRINGGDTAESSATETSTQAMTSVNLLGENTGVVTITLTGNQAGATITGNYCPCDGVWSISSGTITQDGIIDLDSGCGTATVTYTCGELSASADVMMNNGVWVTTYSGIASFGAPPYYNMLPPHADMDCGSIVYGYTPCATVIEVSENKRLTTTFALFTKSGMNTCNWASCNVNNLCFTLVRNLPSGPYASIPEDCPTPDSEHQRGAISNSVEEWRCA